jgi:predicted aspartyl protease
MPISMPLTNLTRRTHSLIVFCALLALAGCEQKSGCDIIKVAQTPIHIRNSALIVEVAINGHPARMLLDTGVSRSLVSEPAKQRLRLVEDRRFLTAHIGIGATTMKADVSIDSMTIGTAPMSVERIGVGTVPDGLAVDGLLGMDILGDFDLDIDEPKRTLSLYRVRRCEIADPPWDEPAIAIPGITTRYGLWRMPFEIDGIAATALIDTGSSGMIIRQPMAHRLGLTAQVLANDRVIRTYGAGGGSSPTYVHRFQSVVIGPLIARDVRVYVLTENPQVMPNGNPMDENLIGQDFLDHRRIWLSYQTDRVAVSRRAGDEQAHQ